MRHRRMALAGTVALLISAAAFAQDAPAPHDRIPIVVRAGGTMEGFSDANKDREDGRRDVVDKLAGSKRVRLVQTEEDAVIVVDILGRTDTSAERTVEARLTVGDQSAEMVGRAGVMGGKRFGRAAGKLADQINDWVKANFAKLASLRDLRQ